MKCIEKSLMNLLKWSDFPKYQLERRIDIFLSAYMKEVLDKYAGIDEPLHDMVIPEFPLLVDREDRKAHSNNVDYLLKTAKELVFVELKTDEDSKRDKQDKYLEIASQKLWNVHLEELAVIVCKTKQIKKYANLIKELEDNKLLDPGNYELIKNDIMERTNEYYVKEKEVNINSLSKDARESLTLSSKIYGNSKPIVIFISPKNNEKFKTVLLQDAFTIVGEKWKADGASDLMIQLLAKLERCLRFDGQM